MSTLSDFEKLMIEENKKKGAALTAMGEYQIAKRFQKPKMDEAMRLAKEKANKGTTPAATPQPLPTMEATPPPVKVGGGDPGVTEAITNLVKGGKFGAAPTGAGNQVSDVTSPMDAQGMVTNTRTTTTAPQTRPITYGTPGRMLLGKMLGVDKITLPGSTTTVTTTSPAMNRAATGVLARGFMNDTDMSPMQAVAAAQAFAKGDDAALEKAMAGSENLKQQAFETAQVTAGLQQDMLTQQVIGQRFDNAKSVIELNNLLSQTSQIPASSRWGAPSVFGASGAVSGAGTGGGSGMLGQNEGTIFNALDDLTDEKGTLKPGSLLQGHELQSQFVNRGVFLGFNAKGYEEGGGLLGYAKEIKRKAFGGGPKNTITITHQETVNLLSRFQSGDESALQFLLDSNMFYLDEETGNLKTVNNKSATHPNARTGILIEGMLKEKQALAQRNLTLPENPEGAVFRDALVQENGRREAEPEAAAEPEAPAKTPIESGADLGNKVRSGAMSLAEGLKEAGKRFIGTEEGWKGAQREGQKRRDRVRAFLSAVKGEEFVPDVPREQTRGMGLPPLPPPE